MQAELTEQIGYEKNQSCEKETKNHQNATSLKTLRTDQRQMEIDDLRDCNGEYEPQIVPKH